MDSNQNIFRNINKAIRAITPGVYNDAQVENLMKIYDVIVAEKEVNPSWQLPSPETRKRKKPRLKCVIGGIDGDDHVPDIGQRLQHRG